jgi:hypothetical protein
MLLAPVQTHDEKNREVKRFYYIDIEKALTDPDSLEDAIFCVGEDRTLRENFGRDIRTDLSSPDKEYELFCFPCNQILNSDKWVNTRPPSVFLKSRANASTFRV